MPLHNSDIEAIFKEVADLLELQDANPFRVRAYRNAARTIGSLPYSITELVDNDKNLTELPGIGDDLSDKIKEICKTGSLKLLKKLENGEEGYLHELLKIPGLGPQKVKILHKALDIESIMDLKEAAKKGTVQKLKGFGAKSEANILKEIKRFKERSLRTPYHIARQIAEPLISYLKVKKGLKDIKIAGSYRRGKETVGDLDILLSCESGTDFITHFVNYEDVEDVISQGKTKSTVILKSGIQVDLRVIPEVSWGAGLFYFTGSKAHNIAVRKLAMKRDLKINEYGVFKNDVRIAGKSEDEMYAQVGLPYIVPELRENRGEIKASAEGTLPELITLDDIRGDLHMHTKKSDGHHSIVEMAQAAMKKGYEYIAITEHSQHVRIARGIDVKELEKQMNKIDLVNARIDGIEILKGIEVDILEDGSLDLPNEILKKLDVVICAVHYRFDLSKEKQTRRIIKAMENPYTNILAHPTGRLIGEREPYDINMKTIMKAAKENNCFLELNSYPLRLDINDHYCKMAKEMNLKVVINSDAHSIDGLYNMTFGIQQARRGWLEAEDVINTKSLENFRKLLKKS
ncbi:DNA polymerase/3'-5' exonuclease PolX [Sulfurovum sp. TSL1]|uniref:DNA polymerase/3'-5' exonuclease PolX n=1 Tax=Sulfurovum sp. TSL1 TaxID=2826994 RepID=UPI001CC398FB|nr:DNA polymerase/3'-5' exonuclease PolX [Sulfurovum sp. TSL1]GIT97816.1 DNA polymerase/3'-5' exonuclease PolX [Sulfurovum sp. TSL1]